MWLVHWHHFETLLPVLLPVLLAANKVTDIIVLYLYMCVPDNSTLRLR
jgi:hypothetical protein